MSSGVAKFLRLNKYTKLYPIKGTGIVAEEILASGFVTAQLTGRRSRSQPPKSFDEESKAYTILGLLLESRVFSDDI